MTQEMHNIVVVKIGTNVITRDDGLLDRERLASIVQQVGLLQKKGKKIVLVSSGAMAAGRASVKLSSKLSDVSERQVLSSVGQVELIHSYNDLFKTHGLHCAQVLATKEDFRDREHYLNMRNCFTALLDEGIIPIVNENDVVSVAELMFTDNDELAGLVAAMIAAESLILLTNVEGIFDTDPKDPSAKILHTIKDDDMASLTKCIRPSTSAFGRGGMITKSETASKAASLGIHTVIASGKREHILEDIIDGKPVGTHFLPRKKKSSTMVRWVAAGSTEHRGSVTITAKAKEFITNKEKAVSLLPIGILNVKGDFEKGDIVKILDEAGASVGLGRASYGSARTREILGKAGEKALIHYDYLFLF